MALLPPFREGYRFPPGEAWGRTAGLLSLSQVLYFPFGRADTTITSATPYLPSLTRPRRTTFAGASGLGASLPCRRNPHPLHPPAPQAGLRPLPIDLPTALRLGNARATS